ncbi:DUF481 domain-containing protein [Parashewanella curva]|uniref:DUF481 domain-containing protein n=1 Tax=Parashewanella curva TaxID=2338552 RepID=A0A3L8Q2U8_9GAMM|nr:DUF481 domain-containing protein [Parashewanella curva]RLV61379.1 DUF481 domain-containing protein [Parashewanella curva]
MKHIIGSLFILLPCTAMANSNWVPGPATFGGTTEFGGTFTTGNTKTSSIKGKVDLKHELGNWENEYIVEGLYKKDESDGKSETTASRYQIGAQGNYRFDEDNYMFANATYENDRFRGFDYRISTAAGYGHKFFDDGGDLLKAEFGPGYVYTKPLANSSANENDKNLVAHINAEFQKKISESATFSQKMTADWGERLDVRSESALSTKVIGALAMKFGVTVRYSSKPLDEKKSTDTETTLTLLYSF